MLVSSREDKQSRCHTREFAPMFFWFPSALKHSIHWFQGCSCCRDVTASLFCEACLEHRRHFLVFEKELFDVSRFWILHSCRVYSILIPLHIHRYLVPFFFFFFWTFLFLQGSVEDRLGPFYSRLGPVEDRCLHLGGCMCQWERLDWSLSSCLVVRKTGWVFQDCGVWFSLPMELVCVSSEIPRTRDTAPFPSSSVGISSLCVRIDPWVLVIGVCRHDFIVFHS